MAELSAGPAFLRAKISAIDRIIAGESIALSGRRIDLDWRIWPAWTKRSVATPRCTSFRANVYSLKSCPVLLLARDEMGWRRGHGATSSAVPICGAAAVLAHAVTNNADALCFHSLTSPPVRPSQAECERMVASIEGVPPSHPPARLLASAQAAKSAAAPHIRDRFIRLLVPAGIAAGVLLLWALLVKLFDIPEYLLPAPQDVASRVVKEWPLLLRNGAYTLMSVMSGFTASVLIGVPIAFAIVLSRRIERVAMPFLVMSQTIPKVAIAPILVVWLGFGILPKIAIVFLISFFPIVVSTVVGLKSVENDMLDLVRSMGARTLKIMLRVRGPSALPQMFAGFKIAICLAVVGAVVGEFVGSDRGLGYLLLTSTGSLDGTLVWAALSILVAMGVTLFAIIAKFERLAIPWHVSMRVDETAAFQS